MELRRLGYDATKSRGKRRSRGISLLKGLCALLLLYLYHFVRSECFWIPSFYQSWGVDSYGENYGFWPTVEGAST